MTAPTGPAARQDVTPVVPLPRSGGGPGTASRRHGWGRLDAADARRDADGTGPDASGTAVAARLALAEARLLLRHPVLLAGCGAYAVSIALGSDGPRDAFDIATAEPSLAGATWRPGTVWAGLQAGSPGWHAVWLTLLCAMAVAGALLPIASRTRLVLGSGALLTALAVAAGSAALP